MFDLQNRQCTLHPACEQIEVNSVKQSLHQLKRQFVCDPRGRLCEEKLQQTITHVVLPIERALQIQILPREKSDIELNLCNLLSVYCFCPVRAASTVKTRTQQQILHLYVKEHQTSGLTFHHTW